MNINYKFKIWNNAEFSDRLEYIQISLDYLSKFLEYIEESISHLIEEENLGFRISLFVLISFHIFSEFWFDAVMLVIDLIISIF